MSLRRGLSGLWYTASRSTPVSSPVLTPLDMASALACPHKAGDLANRVASSPRKRKQEPEQSPVETPTSPSPAKKAKKQATKSSRVREPLAATPELEDEPIVALATTTEKTRPKKDRNSNNATTCEVDEDIEGVAPQIKTETSTPSKTKPKPKTEQKIKSETNDVVRNSTGEGVNGDEPVKKPAKKRKTKEQKEAEAMPLAARTTGVNMYVGAHVSIAKGIENAVTNCVHVGGNAFALFLQSQRKWENRPLAEENKNAFIHACKEHKYESREHVMPHGSYLVNLAQFEKGQGKAGIRFLHWRPQAL